MHCSLRIRLLFACLAAFACAGALAAPCPRLNIGSAPSDTSFVDNGIVNPELVPGAFPSQEVTAYTPFFEMFLSLSGQGFLADLEYFASVSNANASIVASSVDPVTVFGKVTAKRQVAVRIMFLCQSNGQDLVNVTFALTGYDSLTMQWIKTCRVGDARPGLAIASYDWSAAAPTPDVARDGLTMPHWVGDDQTGDYNMLPASVSAQTFFLWLTNGTAQGFAVVADEGDANVLSISVAGATGIARPPNSASSSAAFSVSFVCTQTSGVGFVSVSISVDPFDPLTIAWFKDCTSAPQSADWNAALYAYVVSHSKQYCSTVY